MLNVDILLALLCISSFISVIIIIFGELNNNKDQLSVFLLVCVIVGLLYSIYKKINGKANRNTNATSNNKYELTTQTNTNTNMTSSSSNTNKQSNVDVINPEFTMDKILPVKSYNPEDCTNDGSCIQEANEANLYGFHQKKGESPFKELDKGVVASSTCIRCSRPITIENNPPTELFAENCGCNYCKSEYKKKQKINEMCIYCKSSYIQNSQCFQAQNLPKSYFGKQ
jgi:hypothetical protein